MNIEDANRLLQELREHMEKTELQLFNAGYRHLSSEVYGLRLQLSETMRRFDPFRSGQPNSPAGEEP